MENCLFCKIIKGEVGCEKVYENEYILAFKDIHPVAPVHILIIPKLHISSMNDITYENSEYIKQVYIAIREVVRISCIYESGYRVICNCGEDGGQVVAHLHFHLLGGKHLGSKIVHE
ncbi:MAG: histidine triad nucleotide-binding protein [Clostridia bacterium]|nr:histidine triad nucleotide-binding protein [Clostridia bacterium]MDD4387459.1 histidine triad nucleotide-binding protein [Clostridia bacterium]